jgi:hypothetical protein
MGERYVEFDELHGLKDVISDLRISRDITTSEGTGTLFSNSITQTAKIAEQKTTADRKKRSRFSLLFSLLSGFR